MPPTCPHRPPCPGCPRFGSLGGPEGLRAEVAALAASARLAPPEVRTGRPTGYRHRARLAVRGRTSSPKLGLFQLGTHRIVDIPSCPIHHPAINTVGAAVRDAIRESGVAPYAERPHRGDLRYLQLVVERSSQRVQLVLVGNASGPGALAPLIEALEVVPLNALFWNGQPERSNAILGPHWQHVRGAPMTEESIGRARVFFPPGAFGQSHLGLADEICAQVCAWLPDGARVAEFYAGCGAIGLSLLTRAERVVFNERSPEALAGLEAGLAVHPDRRCAELAEGAAGDRAKAVRGADVVVVDPPRRGLDPPLLDALCADPPSMLVYVSCGWASFVREAERLRCAGLQLTALEAFDLFPYTEHLETLARFERTPLTALRASQAPRR